MKKYTSAAALGLRLTWRNVLIVFLITGVCQCFQMFRMGIQGGFDDSLDALLDGHPERFGLFGLLLVASAVYCSLCGKKSVTAYTLRRLQLSERAVTAIWSLLFAGYFVLYWAYQLGIMLLLYGWFTHLVGEPENLLFLTTFQSSYFHNLLPLHEPWAVVRNIVLYLSFGSFAALSAQNERNGRTFPQCMFFVVVCFVRILYPNEMASQGRDISLSIIALVCLAIDIFWTRRWTRNEAN